MSKKQLLILLLVVVLPGLIVFILIAGGVLTQIELLELRCIEIYIEYLGIVIQAFVLAYYLGRLRRSPDIIISMGPALSRKGHGKLDYQHLFKVYKEECEEKVGIIDDNWELLRIPAGICKVNNKLQLIVELPDITITNVGGGLVEIRGLFIESLRPARLGNGKMRPSDIEIDAQEEYANIIDKIEEYINTQIRMKKQILKQYYSLIINMKKVPVRLRLDLNMLINSGSVYTLYRSSDKFCFSLVHDASELEEGDYIAVFIEIKLRMSYVSIEPGKVEARQRISPFVLVIESHLPS